jgi:hypothetical protein
VTLGPQFPIYEVGGPSHLDDRIVAKNYTTEDEVPPEDFGLPTVRTAEDEDAIFNLVTAKRTKARRDVPLGDITLAQPYVYGEHVRNLATVPQDVLRESQDVDPVEGFSVGKRVIVTDGTHRTTAAKLRGDQTVHMDVWE